MPKFYHEPVEREIPRWKTALNLMLCAIAVALVAVSVVQAFEMIWRMF